MKKLLFIPISLLFLACSNVHTEGEKNVTESGDTIAHEEIVTSRLDALDRLSEEEPAKKEDARIIFKARGSEPGWFAEFTEHHLRFVFDYGKDSLLLDKEFKGLDDKKGYNMDDKNLGLSIKIRKFDLPWPDDKGEMVSSTVEITYHGKPYKGNGWPLK